jgi:hypothetical protein
MCQAENRAKTNLRRLARSFVSGAESDMNHQILKKHFSMGLNSFCFAFSVLSELYRKTN